MFNTSFEEKLNKNNKLESAEPVSGEVISMQRHKGEQQYSEDFDASSSVMTYRQKTTTYTKI